MTNHVARLYLLAASVLGFFVAWAGIAAHPWQQAAAPAPASPALARLRAAPPRRRRPSPAAGRPPPSQAGGPGCPRGHAAAADDDPNFLMLRHHFKAMGTEIELLLEADGDNSPLFQAEDEFRRLESLLSRFQPDSELSRLNRAGELSVGPELLELAELAVAARERTAGRFDPTVHDAVCAAGYDRSFELIDGSAGRLGRGAAALRWPRRRRSRRGPRHARARLSARPGRHRQRLGGGSCACRSSARRGLRS